MIMKVHKERKWDSQRTQCGQIIWVGGVDVTRTYIPKDKRRPTLRGVTCKSCRPRRPLTGQGERG